MVARQLLFPISNFRSDYRDIFEDIPRFFINTLNKKYNANGSFCKDTCGETDSFLTLEIL